MEYKEDDDVETNIEHDDSDEAGDEQQKSLPGKAQPAEDEPLDPNQKLWHEDDGEGDGEGEDEGEGDAEKAPKKDEGPNEVSDDEDEDYETAMKRLQEESGEAQL